MAGYSACACGGSRNSRPVRECVLSRREIRTPNVWKQDSSPSLIRHTTFESKAPSVAHWIGGPTTSKLYFSAIDRSASPSAPAFPRMISQIHLASPDQQYAWFCPHVFEGMCGASRKMLRLPIYQACSKDRRVRRRPALKRPLGAGEGGHGAKSASVIFVIIGRVICTVISALAHLRL